MLLKFLLVMLACNISQSTYDIYRSNCRRYGVFKVHTRNKKLTTGIIATINADYLAQCARTCLRTASCKAINYKLAFSNHESNCEILSSSSDTAETLQAVAGWNFYKPLTQNVSKQQHLSDSILQFFLINDCKKNSCVYDCSKWGKYAVRSNTLDNYRVLFEFEIRLSSFNLYRIHILYS